VDLFEFILIMTSVIYAMAVAQILAGVSRLAQADASIRWFLPHTMWIFILFVYIFLVWWSAWEFRDINWTFPLYLYMAITPTLIFFTCSLLIPRFLDKREVDLEAHFFRIRRPFLSSFLFATIAAVTDGTVLDDEPLWFPSRIGHVILLVTVLVGLWAKNRKTHLAVAGVTMLALIYVTVTRLWIPR
jgi:vacuolar-type H+-ATPase subunit I/STV1